MPDFLTEIKNLKVNRQGGVISLHKPLLLLLTISELYQGHQNAFQFEEIVKPLSNLLAKYGLKNTKALKPEYPFVFLSSNPDLWSCTIDKKSLKNPDAPSRKELAGSVGQFSPDFLQFLGQPKNTVTVIRMLLDDYWPEAYHQDIINDLHLSSNEPVSIDLKKSSQRSRSFIQKVLDTYDKKCAVCGQSVLLGDTLMGIDACHIKPIQHFGEDAITNGIALCKTHHWALDRGAISIRSDYRILVSEQLHGTMAEEFFMRYNQAPIFVPSEINRRIKEENMDYHQKYIFVK